MPIKKEVFNKPNDMKAQLLPFSKQGYADQWVKASFLYNAIYFWMFVPYTRKRKWRSWLKKPDANPTERLGEPCENPRDDVYISTQDNFTYYTTVWVCWRNATENTLESVDVGGIGGTDGLTKAGPEKAIRPCTSSICSTENGGMLKHLFSELGQNRGENLWLSVGAHVCTRSVRHHILRKSRKAVCKHVNNSFYKAVILTCL